jgi:hypothetical protein
MSYVHPSVEVILSPLKRVIGVGRMAHAAGIAVELLAIEVRAAGAIVYWRATPVADQVLWDADVVVSDDRGTTYRSLDGASEGHPERWTGQTYHTPAPPEGAGLHVEVVAFGPRPDHEVPRGLSKQQILGPWVFDVAT